MGNDESREEVPMTAELVEDVTLRMPRSRGWTWEDLQKLPEDDGHRYEIIDGSLHVSPSPTPWHQLVASELFVLLRAAKPTDLLVLTELDVDIGHSVLKPDVLVVRASAVTARTRRLGPADVLLAVEVESPSSRRIDRLAKPSVYAEAGIPAYWRIGLDRPEEPLIAVHELAGDVYREVAVVRAGESVTVDLPFAVELRPAELVMPGRED